MRQLPRARPTILPARGRYGALKLAGKTKGQKAVTLSAANDDGHEAAYAGPTGYQLVQFWQDNASFDCIDDYSPPQQDWYFPHL